MIINRREIGYQSPRRSGRVWHKHYDCSQEIYTGSSRTPYRTGNMWMSCYTPCILRMPCFSSIRKASGGPKYTTRPSKGTTAAVNSYSQRLIIADGYSVILHWRGNIRNPSHSVARQRFSEHDDRRIQPTIWYCTGEGKYSPEDGRWRSRTEHAVNSHPQP